MNRVRSRSSRFVAIVVACIAMFYTGQGLWAQVQEPPNPHLLIASTTGSVGFDRVSMSVPAPVTRTLTLLNGGTQPLTVTSIIIDGPNPADFSLVSSTCGTMGPAGFCSLTLGFRPLANGARMGFLTIADNAGGTPHIVRLLGIGVDGTIPQPAVGPIDPRYGFPISFSDGTTSVELCLYGPLCLSPLPDQTLPPSITEDRPANFPPEGFWWSADAVFNIGAAEVVVVMAQEAAFASGEIPLPGDQVAFGRLRFRLRKDDANTNGKWFRFTHPFGVDEFLAEPDIFATSDIGCFTQPCDYSQGLPGTTRIQKYFGCASPAPPAGYLGDPNIACTITTAPSGFNFVRLEEISGPGGTVVAGGLSGQTDLFAISGKLAGTVTAPQTTVVPGVIGQTQAAATAAITAAGLVTGAITTATSATVPTGSVISQSPLSGTTVPLGSAVALEVSLGPPTVLVPNVVNLTQAAATSAITGAGLVVGTVVSGNSATVPAGSVISQNPAAGASVAPGSAVALLISLGPANVLVPNVVNQPEATAVTMITAAGLSVGAITNANHATILAGRVISSNPAAGVSAAPGSSVALVVSLGPATGTVPNVVNLLQADASTAITAAGLTVGAITTANHATILPGRVISSNPAAGTLVVPGSAVALLVSLGPASVSVPNVVNLTQAAASTAITGVGLAVGAITNANSATVPAGSVISSNPAAGALVAPGSAVALVVSLGPLTGGGPTVVASVNSPANGRGNRTVQITTAVPTRLVAFISADGPQNVGTGGQFVTVSGGGLTWTLVRRANLQFGDAEIWTADAPAPLAAASITGTLLRHRTGSDYIQQMRVVAFTGVSGIGASNAVSGQTVATASISITAQAAGSVVYAVGEDWTSAVSRTVGAGQTRDLQVLGADGDTFWFQRTTSPIAAAGAVTFTATTATQPAPGNRWNFAIVELLR